MKFRPANEKEMEHFANLLAIVDTAVTTFEAQTDKYGELPDEDLWNEIDSIREDLRDAVRELDALEQAVRQGEYNFITEEELETEWELEVPVIIRARVTTENTEPSGVEIEKATNEAWDTGHVEIQWPYVSKRRVE